MVEVHELYTQEIYEQFRCFATWPPNIRLALGDVGLLRRYRFEKITTLADLGVTAAHGDSGPVAEFQYSTTGQVQINVGAEAALPGMAAAPASIALTFSKEGATYFRALRAEWMSLANLDKLGRDLARLRERGVWRPEFVVVTRLLQTGPTTVVVASSKGATVELRVSTEGLLEQAVPVNAASGLNAVTTSGLATSMIVPDGATPLFAAASLRRSLAGAGRLRFRGGSSAASELVLAPWTQFAAPADPERS